MTTYQDILDYLTKNYDRGYRLFSNEPEVGLYTFTNEGYNSIIIYKDSYSTSLSLIIDSKLSHLLADLLDTPVNKRINSEIKHNVKPVTKESVYTANLLTSADQVIRAINTFLLSARCNSTPVMTIGTDIGVDNLNKVLKLYGDYNIIITNQVPMHNYTAFNLLIEP